MAMPRKRKEGQHFRCVLTDKSGENVLYLDPNDWADQFRSLDENGHDYLMWHSWMGNPFMSAVLHVLTNNPMRVAWVGSCSVTAVQNRYRDGVLDLGDGFIEYPEHFESRIFRKIDLGSPFPENGSENKIDPEKLKALGDFAFERKVDGSVQHMYLVNVTKGLYFDLQDYMERNNLYDEYSVPWCISPLPLLTAVSNGYKNGDYYHNTGKPDVGTWAFDEIYVTSREPCGSHGNIFTNRFIRIADMRFKSDRPK